MDAETTPPPEWVYGICIFVIVVADWEMWQRGSPTFVLTPLMGIATALLLAIWYPPAKPHWWWLGVGSVVFGTMLYLVR